MAVRPAPRFTAANAAISPGLSPRMAVESCPNRPLSPLPQHLTVPSSNNAHVCWDPAVTAVAVRPAPRFTAGNDAISPAPSPSPAAVPCPNCP